MPTFFAQSFLGPSAGHAASEIVSLLMLSPLGPIHLGQSSVPRAKGAQTVKAIVARVVYFRSGCTVGSPGGQSLEAGVWRLGIFRVTPHVSTADHTPTDSGISALWLTL